MYDWRFRKKGTDWCNGNKYNNNRYFSLIWDCFVNRWGLLNQTLLLKNNNCEISIAFFFTAERKDISHHLNVDHWQNLFSKKCFCGRDKSMCLIKIITFRSIFFWILRQTVLYNSYCLTLQCQSFSVIFVVTKDKRYCRRMKCVFWFECFACCRFDTECDLRKVNSTRIIIIRVISY